MPDKRLKKCRVLYPELNRSGKESGQKIGESIGLSGNLVVAEQWRADHERTHNIADCTTCGQPAPETKKFEHVCGLEGYNPGPPDHDPFCPACLLSTKPKWLIDICTACDRCKKFGLCGLHASMVGVGGEIGGMLP